MMKTIKKEDEKAVAQPKKRISKLGRAMRKGILKGAFIELDDDVWGLKAV